MTDVDQVRDCEHGRQKGKCDTCSLAQAEARIAELEVALREVIRHGEYSISQTARDCAIIALAALGETK